MSGLFDFAADMCREIDTLEAFTTFDDWGLIADHLRLLVNRQLAAERFAIWLLLAPILGDLAELNRDNDDGHVTGFEITLFQRRMQAALEAIGQGLHRFEEPFA